MFTERRGIADTAIMRQPCRAHIVGQFARTRRILRATRSSFYSNSMAAYVVFAQGLLNLVARELGDSATTALTDRERLIAEMRVGI